MAAKANVSVLASTEASEKHFASIERENHMRRSEYENKLAKLNFPLLGKGMYANVFAIPNTDKVMKVARNDAWPVYIKWASENGHMGKFAPKVDSLKFFDGFYVAVMERLAGTMHDFEAFSTGHYKAYREAVSYGWSRPKRPSRLGNYIQKLRDAGLAGDLHPGNVMVRKNGQIVVTDPTSREFDVEPFKIKSGKTLSP